MNDTEIIDYTDFYNEAHLNISKTDYAKERGLTDLTLNRFKIGFVEQWSHPLWGQKAYVTPRMIIPITKHSYFSRDIRTEVPEYQKKYIKQKVGGQNIFNSAALFTESSSPIFVTEGEIDALSVMEVGGESIALGGIHTNQLLHLLKENNIKKHLILLFDNDEAGMKSQLKLADDLKKLGIPFSTPTILLGNAKDANEMLVRNRSIFQNLIESAIVNTTNKSKTQYDFAVSNHLKNFIAGIADSVNTPVISTGLTKLDETLDGGLYEGLYVVGAISSLGKTTFVTQIADNIAESGKDVLIVSLEMSRNEIMSKSISRNTIKYTLDIKENAKNAKTVRGITDVKRYEHYSEKEKGIIEAAINNYDRIADHVYIMEGRGDVGVMEIRKAVEEHKLYTNQFPVLIIDYLQILSPSNVFDSDKRNIDKSVMELKRISRDFKIPVLVISSFNRDNYNNKVSMQSFKESGAIEYSSDVLIGLQLKGAGENGFDVDAAKSKFPREVELVILKNRNGETGKKINLQFYAMFNYFSEGVNNGN